MSWFDKLVSELKHYDQYSDDLANRLRELQRRPALSSEELNDLILQISIGRFAGKQLFAKQYADDSEKQQLTEIVRSGEEAVRQVTEQGWVYILPSLTDYITSAHHFEELLEIGYTALHRALITYHHVPNCRFQEYVTVWIRQLLEESFQDNSVFVPSLRQLTDYQVLVENKLERQLQRSPTVEEIALAMRYLPVRQRREILNERAMQRPLSATHEQALRLAVTKVLLVRHYKELTQEFTMTLTVTVEGESHFFDNVVRIEQALAQEVKELYRCGVSRFTDREQLKAASEAWRCPSCRQQQRTEGCGRWQEVTFLHRHPERICLWLDDGRKFFIEDDFWAIARQLSSSLE